MADGSWTIATGRTAAGHGTIQSRHRAAKSRENKQAHGAARAGASSNLSAGQYSSSPPPTCTLVLPPTGCLLIIFVLDMVEASLFHHRPTIALIAELPGCRSRCFFERPTPAFHLVGCRPANFTKFVSRLQSCFPFGSRSSSIAWEVDPTYSISFSPCTTTQADMSKCPYTDEAAGGVGSLTYADASWIESR